MVDNHPCYISPHFSTAQLKRISNLYKVELPLREKFPQKSTNKSKDWRPGEFNLSTGGAFLMLTKGLLPNNNIIIIIIPIMQ